MMAATPIESRQPPQDATAPASTGRPRRRSLMLLAALGATLAGCVSGGTPPPHYQAAIPPDETFTMADGARLPVRAWLPDGDPWAVVLALHGFSDSRDAWEIPAPAFAGDGIALFAPDQRGFGAAPGRGFWPGSRTLTDDVRAMAAMLRARYPHAKFFLMGESMGAAELMVLAAEPDPPPATAYVMLAPAVWGRAEMNLFLRSGIWLAATFVPGLSISGHEVPLDVRASDNHEALLRLSNDELTLHRTRFDALRGLVDLMDEAVAAAPKIHVPALFLYGGRDDFVPKPATATTWRALPPDVHRAFYPEGHHLLLRDLDRDQTIGDVIAWMHRPGETLTSPAEGAAKTWLAAQPK